ncbi:hypothetical protein LEP1GSC062_0130 [Leptospira alexanderi serovar Manhao 3 str. L 60]|uniref:Uncharacterized protein n=2 Tax=Leptospiraceae TaxID=170 RepID=V6IDA0_9LEPT|nr:hypothetical protein LEP1GSC062_0130 [Leptospira alexanderi serovar Manhao 3 str. L 60]
MTHKVSTLIISIFIFHGCVFTGRIKNYDHLVNSNITNSCMSFSEIKLEFPDQKINENRKDRFRFFDNINRDTMVTYIETKLSSNKKLNNLKYKMIYSEEASIPFNFFNIVGTLSAGIFPIHSNRISNISMAVFDSKQNQKIHALDIKIPWSAYYSLWGGILYPFSNVEKKQNEVIGLAVNIFLTNICFS